MPGTLFVVATPIGNLEDLTFRALRILREVDLIAAEDTRRTAKLLAHYEVRRPLTSLHEHNELRETPRLIAALSGGRSIALVSDAGTPGISDPGSRLVQAVREAGLTVVPIPGSSAVATALSAAGFPGGEFCFMGFVPRSGTAREVWFDRLAADSRTVVFFEGPHRIRRTLHDLKHKLVDRQIVVCREMTKINEEFVIHHTNVPMQEPREQGEFSVVVAPKTETQTMAPEPAYVLDLFGRMTDIAGIDPSVTTPMLASFLGVSEREVKKALKRARILVNRQNDASP